MRGEADTHTRVVYWLKILLPLAALAILSTLFLFSRDFAPEGLLPFSEVDVEDLAREQRLTAPEFAGMTSDGAGVTIKAATARPELPGTQGASAEAIEAAYARGDFRATMTADQGLVNQGAGIVTLDGGVNMETSTGYRLTTGAIVVRLDRTLATAPGAVEGRGPLGTIDAGAMELRSAPGEENRDVLVFNKGVRLVYDPKGREAE